MRVRGRVARGMCTRVRGFDVLGILLSRAMEAAARAAERRRGGPVPKGAAPSPNVFDVHARERDPAVLSVCIPARARVGCVPVCARFFASMKILFC